MALIILGNGIKDIRGGVGGIYYHRDKSGLHVSSKPRTINKCSDKQTKQRKAFIKARRWSKDNRTVSYLIYLALNEIPFTINATASGNPDPDCTGLYLPTGTHDEKPYYTRRDGLFFIWWMGLFEQWVISDSITPPYSSLWYRDYYIEGDYTQWIPNDTTVTVKLTVEPPPTTYQIPKM